MTAAQGAQVSEAQIAVHWREEEYYHPPAKFVAQANGSDPALFERFSEAHFPECFKEYADLLTWDSYWHTTLDTSKPPFWKWFVGGRLNACYNCVDRHLATSRNRAAFIWVPEPEAEATKAITYQELYRQVNEFAALLRGVCDTQTGDRITFHLPMVPELPVSMLACARLGVIHSQVFGGFSGAACGDRVADSQSRVLVTMDGYYRNGELIDHKSKADEAVEAARRLGHEIEKVLVWRRHPGEYASASPMVPGRDFFVDDLLVDYRGRIVEPVSMPAEAPLFLMYTSGTTGRPKGCQHSTGGYLAYVAGTSKYYQDIHPDDTYWCAADIGWITGHSYIVYGPLALGTTSVMYEGVPAYPDAGRLWRIAERLGVNIFHTAPTTIRMLRKLGPHEPAAYDIHFKHMTTVGEPIEPEVWRWYYEAVGKREAAIVDTWWQTENGGFLGSTLPALQPMKPGSCGPGVLGIYPVILDEDGVAVEAGSGKAGNICIRNPWPGIFQTIWGQPERFVDIYYAEVLPEPGEHGLARLAVLRRRRRRAGRGRLLPDPRPCRRRDQRGGPPAGHEGTRIGLPHRRGGGRGGRGAGDGRAAGAGRRDVRRAQTQLLPEQGDRGEGQPRHRPGDRQDRTSEERVDRFGHAKNPLRQDHAAGHREHLQLRRCRGRDDPGQPRGRRGDPARGAEREGGTRRAAARADAGGADRDQGVRAGRVDRCAGRQQAGVGADISVTHATCTYSCTRPPSRSRPSGRTPRSGPG